MADEQTIEHEQEDRTPVTRRDLVEGKFEKVFPARPEVPIEGGAVTPLTLAQQIDFAKALSMSRIMVPDWLRGNVGDCLAIVSQAVHWGMEPVAVARMVYAVESAERGTRIEYQAQLLHALVEARAPLKQRLRFTYDGEGETRRCYCTGHIRGEVDPLVYTSPILKDITPKKSPLWKSDPDQQLAYYSSRAWARRYVPDVLMGVYSEDDEPTALPEPRDITKAATALEDRLRAAQQARTEPAEGFQEPDKVISALSDGQEPTSAAAQPSQDALEAAQATDHPAKASQRASEPPSENTQKVQKPKTTAKPAKVPTNPQDYRKHVSAWLRDYSTEQDIEERWKSERRLRNACGLVEADRDKTRILLDQRIAELRKK